MYDNEQITKGYHFYKMFMAVKLHFTSDSYDFMKYNGKTRCKSIDEYRLDKGFAFFQKASRKYRNDPVTVVLAAGFSVKPKAWITDFVNNSDISNTIDHWKSWIDSPAYKTFQEIEKANLDLNEAFKWPEDKPHPDIIKAFIEEKISLISIVGLNKLLDFTSKWDDNRDLIIWSDLKRTILKCDPFVTIKKKSYAKYLKRLVDAYI